MGAQRFLARLFSVLMSLLLIGLMVALWFSVLSYYRQRKVAVLESWTQQEMQIVQEAARATQAWLELRIEHQGISKTQAEQEVFQLFIEPIQLLQNGDAFIYSRDYIIFDLSTDLPEEYVGKNIRDIFELQAAHGAQHYEDLVNGVENATEGTGWYVWLPDKGREFVAWTSVRLVDDTWTIGLSTPEAEIVAFSKLDIQFRRELVGAAGITVLLLIRFFVVWQQQRKDRFQMELLERLVASRTADLSSSETRYRVLVDNIREGIVIFDLSTYRIIFANPAAKSILGKLTPDNLEGDDLLRLLPDEVRLLAEAASGQLRIDADASRQTLKLATLQGETLWIETVSTRVEFDGLPAGLLHVVDISERKRVDVALGRYAERLQQLSHRLLQVQESERRHIARELHDEVGQILTGLKFSLEGSLQAAPKPLKDNLNSARALVSDLITRVREISLNLRPSMLDDLGLLPALKWQCERYTAQTDIQVVFEFNRLERRFPPEIETAAYRIVQEALTNVARHAGVDQAFLEVWSDDEQIGVQVIDHGKGFDTGIDLATSHTTGLSGMSERVALLGGTWCLMSAPGLGTQVKATFPLDERDKESV